MPGNISGVSPGPSGPGVMPFNSTQSGLQANGILFAVKVPPPPQKPKIVLTVYQTLQPGTYTGTLT